MRLTRFGATGKAGQLLVRHALDQGHQVTAYARNPIRLDARPGLTVVAGELNDRAAARAAVTGADAVISLLGPGRDKASIEPLVPGMQTIVDQMTETGVRRLVATSTPSAPDPADRRDLRIRAMVTGIRLSMAPASTPSWAWQPSSGPPPWIGPSSDCPCSTTSRPMLPREDDKWANPEDFASPGPPSPTS